MTWQRVQATSFEDQYTGDIIVGSKFGQTAVHLTSDKAHTGQWSMKDDDYTRYGFHLQNAYASARMGCWCSIGTSYINETGLMGLGGYQATPTPDYQNHSIRQSSDGSELVFERTTLTVLTELGRVALAELNVSAGEWVALSLSARAGDPGSVSFYVNGVEIFRHEAVVFPTDIFYFLTRGLYSPTINTYMDDMYADVSEETEPETIPQSPRFVASFPMSEGMRQDWKKSGGINKESFLRLPGRRKRDMPVLYSDAPDQVQTFKIDHSRLYEDYIVNGVIVRARALSGDYAGNPTLRFVITDGVNTDESPPVALAAGYRTVHHRFAERPGGGPWGVSMNGMEVGVKS